jgi:thioesterase domain-containing protein
VGTPLSHPSRPGVNDMETANPVLIQNPPPGTRGRHAIPLVLIHDGGGTIFSYYFLDDISRRLYAVSDPRFNTDKKWEGGITEMATHYSRLIKAAVPRGQIILGGWSLGGLTAVNVARLLADDPALDVVGLIFIDTICPMPPQGKTWDDVEWPAPVKQREIEWSPKTREDMRVVIERTFAESTKMAWAWGPQAPSWRDDSGRELTPPPAILLRAQEKVPVEGGMVLVDIWRDDHRLLGWNHYRNKFISRVLDIPGNHYGAFDKENLFTLSEQLKTALKTIDELAGEDGWGGIAG